jgi:hypothetical protein
MSAAVSVRPTADVDIIVTTASRGEWYRLIDALEERGFAWPSGSPVCRYAKGNLVVDVMPTDESQLGFTNRWYAAAARDRMLAPGLEEASVHVVTPIYFVATKLDAFADRGAHDPYASHDLEDIFVVVRGLPLLVNEIATGTGAVYEAVREGLRGITARPDALDLLRGHLEGDAATQALAVPLLQRLREACSSR